MDDHQSQLQFCEFFGFSGFRYEVGLTVWERKVVVGVKYFQVIGLFVGIGCIPSGLSTFLFGYFDFMKQCEEAYGLCQCFFSEILTETDFMDEIQFKQGRVVTSSFGTTDRNLTK